jgi:hypothetical protein
MVHQHVNPDDNIFGDRAWCDANIRFESCWHGDGSRDWQDLFYHAHYGGVISWRTDKLLVKIRSADDVPSVGLQKQLADLNHKADHISFTANKCRVYRIARRDYRNLFLYDRERWFRRCFRLVSYQRNNEQFLDWPGDSLHSYDHGSLIRNCLAVNQ